MEPDLLGYAGRQVVVVGGATGMGQATAELALALGADVTVYDYAPVNTDGVKSGAIDLRDQASIEATANACPAIDVLFSCAGVANGTPGIDLVNFAGQRHLIEGLGGLGKLRRGSVIGIISSVAGLGWESKLDVLDGYLDTPDFTAAAAWIAERPQYGTYAWSKRAMCAYVARQAYPMAKSGIRINSIMPGPTDTPLSRANPDVMFKFAADYRADTGTKMSTPKEQAQALVFLGSRAAVGINGVNLLVDAGYVSAGLSGAYPAPLLKAMLAS